MQGAYHLQLQSPSTPSLPTLPEPGVVHICFSYVIRASQVLLPTYMSYTTGSELLLLFLKHKHTKMLKNSRVIPHEDYAKHLHVHE